MALWTPANLSGSKLHRWIKGESFSHSGSTITGGTTSDSSASTITKVSTNWPTYNSSGLNGYSTITSGGSNLMSIPVDIDYDCSVFVVVKPNALSGYHNVYELSGDKCPMLWIDSSNRYSFNGAGRVIEPSTPTADGSTWRVVSTINRASGTRSEERIDGTSKGTAGESVDSLNVGTGLTLKLLGRSDGNGLQGDVAEIVITYGALTSDDEARIEGYLAWKYGLQGNLDSGHTYKSAAPTDGSSDSTGTGTGSGAASGIGAALFAGTGSGSGTGATGAVAGATHAGTGAATGVGALSMTGAAHWAATGSTVGAGAAAGVGDSATVGSALGAATGSSTSSMAGAALWAAVGAAAGAGVVVGIGASHGGVAAPAVTVGGPGSGRKRRYDPLDPRSVREAIHGPAAHQRPESTAPAPIAGPQELAPEQPHTLAAEIAAWEAQLREAQQLRQQVTRSQFARAHLAFDDMTRQLAELDDEQALVLLIH